MAEQAGLEPAKVLEQAITDHRAAANGSSDFRGNIKSPQSIRYMVARLTQPKPQSKTASDKIEAIQKLRESEGDIIDYV